MINFLSHFLARVPCTLREGTGYPPGLYPVRSIIVQGTVVIAALLLASVFPASAAEKIDFNTRIRPQLSDYDFTCDRLEMLIDEKNKVKEWTATGQPVQISMVSKDGKKQVAKGDRI